MIFDGSPDGEVIQGLKLSMGIPSQHAMDGTIEKTPDAGGPDPRGFRLEIQHLTDQSGFPEQAFIKPWSMFLQ